MKNSLFCLSMALLLMLCSCAKSSDEREALAQRVNEIYTEAFGCYEKMDSLANAGVDTLMANGLDAKFCTQDWNTLVKRVNDWDNQHNEGMMGFFEADYWIMGQDWQDLSVSDVQVKSISETTAVVELVLHNCGNAQPVRLEMAKEDGVWKIDNFIDVANDVDWKSGMKEYLSESEKSE